MEFELTNAEMDDVMACDTNVTIAGRTYCYLYWMNNGVMVPFYHFQREGGTERAKFRCDWNDARRIWILRFVTFYEPS